MIEDLYEDMIDLGNGRVSFRGVEMKEPPRLKLLREDVESLWQNEKAQDALKEIYVLGWIAEARWYEGYWVFYIKLGGFITLLSTGLMVGGISGGVLSINPSAVLILMLMWIAMFVMIKKKSKWNKILKALEVSK